MWKTFKEYTDLPIGAVIREYGPNQILYYRKLSDTSAFSWF